MSGKLNLGTRLQNIPTPEESYNILFGTATNAVQRIKLCDITFHEQRTRMYSNEELEVMAESIKEKGVLEPILVRRQPADDEIPFEHYQALNGRNRTEGSRLAGMEDIPAIVIDADDNEAAYIVSTTTLNQRRTLLPSEIAFACKMFMDSNSKMGARTDLVQLLHKVENDEDANLVQPLHKVDTLAEYANKVNVSRRTMAYYIRLTLLVQPLLTMVDDNKLLFMAGVALSYLSQDEQLVVDAYLLEHRKKLTVPQADDIKRYSMQVSPITYTQLDRLFCTSVPTGPLPTELKTIKFGKKDVARMADYIPVVDPKKAADYVIKALKFYRENGGGA